MESIFKFVRRFSIQIIVVTLVLTAIMGYFALQIDIEAGITALTHYKIYPS